MGTPGNRGNVVPVAKRKYRQPNYNPRSWNSSSVPWGTRYEAKPTEFELLVASLGTPEQYWAENTTIQKWVHANKNYKYVPESLLNLLGEHVTVEGWEA
jgi:hypothetical protein